MGCLSYCSFHGIRCYGTRSYGQIKSRRAAVYASATSTQPLKTINYQINAQNQFTGYTQAAGTTPEGNPAPGLTPDILPQSETYTYTALNQVETVTVNLGGFSKTYAYTYYPNGLKHTYTNPEGITYTYYYNKNNQLTAVHIPGQGQLTWSDFQWLMPQTLLLPGGTKITLSYNDFLQVEERILKDPANNHVASALYEYDREHNIRRITSEQGLYSFDYDNLYRLTHADYPLDTAANDEVFAYDGVGNRTGHTQVENTGELPVDEESNGEEGEGETGEGDNPNPPTNRTDIALVYNNQNQLTQATGDTGTAVIYTYNANGHTATKTDNGTTTEYVYNHEERLIAVRVNGITVGEYAYNPYGMRIKKTTYANGTPTTTWYLYNDKGLAAEYDSSGNLRKEYHFHPQKTWMTDPLFQRTADGQVYYYQNDHLGTPQRLIKSNGATVWRATYTAFGEASVDPDSSIENNLRFPGQYYDQETGLHHNYFRDYDPHTGRYLQADPIGLMGGLNNFSYVKLNPLNLLDPHGLVDLNYIPVFEPSLHAGADKVDDGDHVFTVAAHGNPQFIEHRKTKIDAKKLAEKIKDHPKYKEGMTVKLYACNVGATESGFAQRLANELPGSEIIGPNDYVWFNEDGYVGIYGKSDGDDIPDKGKPGSWQSFHSINQAANQ